MARVGGGGGHTSHSSSGGSHSYSSSSYSSGGYYGGGGSLSFTAIIVIIIIVVIILLIIKKNGGLQQPGDGGEPANDTAPVPMPPGLDTAKISTAFLNIQDAWQRRDLASVRRWLSDGMYQRLTTQFAMMDKLGQKNILSNIRIYKILAAHTAADGNYQTADIAISFSMDDSFVSQKYPQFNEVYDADTDAEYWTFIKRLDSEGDKNLYDNANCPNCGAPFEVKMGEISRCSNCNTLTNSAAYDWVLSEITQQDDYTGGAGLPNDMQLRELMAGDPFFAVQRMEDIASNIFMQIMEVFAGGDNSKLSRFAELSVANMLLQQKKNTAPFVFDRLYLNEVTLTRHAVEGNQVELFFELTATYRRVSVDGRLQVLDNDFVTRPFSMQLSRNKDVMKTNKPETVYSHECSSCGAPYTDTTTDRCTYCDAPVVDKRRDWVLTGFTWG